MSLNIKPLSVPSKALAQSITSASMSFKLKNVKGWARNILGKNIDLTPDDFGVNAFGVFRNETGSVMEIFEFDPNTIASPSITILKRGLDFNGDPNTEYPNYKLDWAAGSTIVQLGTDTPQFLQWLKDYINEIAIAGAPDASSSQKGISKLTVDPVSPTEPKAVGDNDPRVDFVSIVNKASRSVDQTEDEGRVAKLEDDGKIHQDFIKAPGVITMIANEDLIEGTPVGVCDGLDGYVARAFRKIELGQYITPFNASYTNSLNIAWVSSNKFVLAWANYSAPNYSVYVRCGTININTKEVSFGDAVVAFTGTVVEYSSVRISELSDNKFIVLWNDASATMVYNAKVGTISGNAITLGSMASSANVGGFQRNVMITKLTSSLIVVGGYHSTASYKKIVTISISGTTATFGTLFNATSITDTGDELVKVSNTSFAHVIKNSFVNNIAVGTISGDVITMGSYSTVDVSNSAYLISARYMQDNIIAISSYTSSPTYKQLIYLLTISGTTVTTTTTNTFRTNLSGPNSSIRIAPKSSSELLVYCTMSTYDNESSGIYRFSISGATISAITKIAKNQAELDSIYGSDGLHSFDIEPINNYYALFNSRTNYTGYVSLFIEGMSANFVGIVQSTVSKGEEVDVLVRGIDIHQLGLAPGQDYIPQKGQLSLAFNNYEDLDARYNSLSFSRKVRAIGTTKIII